MIQRTVSQNKYDSFAVGGVKELYFLLYPTYPLHVYFLLISHDINTSIVVSFLLPHSDVQVPRHLVDICVPVYPTGVMWLCRRVFPTDRHTHTHTKDSNHGFLIVAKLCVCLHVCS